MRSEHEQSGGQDGGAGVTRAVRVLGCPVPAWIRRLGLAAFLFFLIKGLAWLIVPAVLVWWGSR